jgi:hypothetical protein
VLPTRSTTDSAYCTGSSSTRARSGSVCGPSHQMDGDDDRTVAGPDPHG